MIKLTWEELNPIELTNSKLLLELYFNLTEELVPIPTEEEGITLNFTESPLIKLWFLDVDIVVFIFSTFATIFSTSLFKLYSKLNAPLLTNNNPSDDVVRPTLVTIPI